jgi:hypothetical protein
MPDSSAQGQSAKGAADVRGRRNAVVLVSDNRILPAARFLWARLMRLNPRQDTDVLLASESRLHTVDGIEFPEQSAILLDEITLPAIEFPGGQHWTVATYARLALPRMLQDRYAKIVYLDIDIYPLDARLFDLFDIQLTKAPIAGVRDLGSNFSSGSREPSGSAPVRAGKYSFKRYFNCGVLYLNVDAWVAANLDERSYDVIRQEGPHLVHVDQTALNLALDDAWEELSPAMNFWVGALGSIVERAAPPSILHYMGGIKMWTLPAMQPNWPALPRKDLFRFLIRSGDLPFIFWNVHPGRFLRAQVQRFSPRGRNRERPLSYLNADNAALMEYLAGTFIERLV